MCFRVFEFSADAQKSAVWQLILLVIRARYFILLKLLMNSDLTIEEIFFSLGEVFLDRPAIPALFLERSFFELSGRKNYSYNSSFPYFIGERMILLAK